MIDIINKVCKELPTGFEIRLYMENGAAWIEMFYLRCTVDYDPGDSSLLSKQLEEALNFAKKCTNEGIS